MIAPIEATGLGKRFGRTWALRDCSIRVPAGKIAGLVGPNGAGKTTFLHLAAGLLRPSSGEIRVFGRSPQSQLLLLLDRLGFVAQDTPLYSGFSVADMLRFGQKRNGPWDPAAAEARLRSLDIPSDKQSASCRVGSDRKSRLPSPWASIRNCSFWMSRWQGLTHSLAANSCSGSPRPWPRKGAPCCSHRT